MKKENISDRNIKILEDYNNKTSVKELSIKYLLSKTTIYGLIKNEIKYGNNCDNVSMKEYLNLKNKYEKTLLELSVIKDSNCLPSFERFDKLKALSNIYGKYPTKTMCKILNVNHSTFYNHHLRRVKETKKSNRDKLLKEKIIYAFNKSEERFGVKKITYLLRKENIEVSPKKVSLIMKELKLVPDLPKKRTFKPKENNNKYFRNILRKEFVREKANEVWVGDITEFYVHDSKYYLCAVIDLFSRKILAINISYRNSHNLTSNTFKEAFETRNEPKKLMFHSDRGTQYASLEFRNLLKNLKVQQSFSNTSNPYDNAVIESFFSTLKREEINRKNYKDSKDLKISIEKYMDFYNNYRPHEFLNGMSPSEFENIKIKY